MLFQTENNKRYERKKSLLYLIEQYLKENGLNNTAVCLRKESGLNNDYELCENLDLDSIFLEYCSYFNLKFGKPPKILKTLEKPEVKFQKKKNMKKAEIQGNVSLQNSLEDISIPLTESVSVTSFSTQSKKSSEKAASNFHDIFSNIGPSLSYNSTDWQNFRDIVSRDIVSTNYSLTWDHVFGNTEAIEIIKEAFLLPLEYPNLFSEHIKPWKSVLLHGPPGTGKTFLAKVLASEIFGRMTFFNISASTIISKWRGESEKIIRVLFDCALKNAPSLIFFDEIESLASKRDISMEHEASRRFKNEFLSLLDGLESEKNGIFILANTNLPWEIDHAFLRRFERKVLTRLPRTDERKKMIMALLPDSKNWSNDLLNTLAQKCDGFTGDEIRLACKEAIIGQLRLKGKLTKNNEQKTDSNYLYQAFEHICPTGNILIKKHIEWRNQFGHKL